LHGYLVAGFSASRRAADHAGVKSARPAAGAVAAAAVAEPATGTARHGGRRRGRLIVPGYRYEYLEDSEPDSAAPTGYRPAGFAGTLGKAGVARAAGLAALTGAEFGGGPTVPLLPDSWESQDTAAPTD